MAIRFLTAGESHGETLSGIIEGIPYGYELDFNFINSQLSLRQSGIGRGYRMKIENDKIKITSGVRHSITTASPIAFTIQNKDWENWIYPMSIEKINYENLDDDTKNEIRKKLKEKIITKFRPSHADLAGCIKYNYEDIRYVLERSSARETAARVAIGAICQNILKYYDINFSSTVLSIGKCVDKNNFETYVENFKQKGDSLGGIIQIIVKNVPAGLGSFVHWDRRLDGRLAQAVMSIPAIKSVEIGLGKEYSKSLGSESHDEIYYENKKYYRKTNNSGGIEGGMSNGEDIVLTVAMKPVPTIKKPLHSVEIKSHKETLAHYERADNCAVEAAGVVACNMAAIIIADEFLEKFGHDSKIDIDAAFKNYKKRINEV